MRAFMSAASIPSPVRRFLWTVSALALIVASVETVIGDVNRELGGLRRTDDGFSLFAVPRLVLASNKLQCTLFNDGDVCANSELGPGGAFPTGTPDSYIFNSGFQIAGVADSEAGPWAGDTVGAYLIDTTGLQKHGTELTQIYDSLNPEDMADWPEEAVIDDPVLFAPILLGRKTASQHDSWVQYWDGDPRRNSGRSHPMGFRVTQRSMAWNYPSGNESVIYFVMEFENVTDDPEFQRLNELTFFGGDDALPDEGWGYDEVFVSVTADNDVGNDFFGNYASAIFPFNMGISYHGGFNEPLFDYPSSVFHAPFFVDAPGIVAFKYLRSPLDPQTGEEVGLTMISVYGWPGIFNDPLGDKQLWRYLSGRMDVGTGDPPCNIAAEIQTFSPATTKRSICNVEQESKDIRFFQSSGPFSVGAGEASTVVAAYVIAPVVETMPDGTPSGIIQSEINSSANPPGFPSFHPGFASARGCDVNGQNCTESFSAGENPVKIIERGAGWISYDGPPPSGAIYPPAVEHPSNAIDEFQIRVVPGSLLGRALVAQTVFNNKFLLGFPPDPPAFYLVPGDDQVTVLWEESATEEAGDPFFEVAGDPESALYNPNYRQSDVEGYRIWRGTRRGQLNLLMQFDYANTQFLDYNCETVAPEEDVGATDADGNPVLGFAVGDTCPLDADNPLVRSIDGSLIFNNGFPGGAPGAGVSRSPVSLTIDTAIVSDRDVGEVRPLRDNGVPFSYVDTDVRDNFTYFYSVTAFDLNSQTSGPHTLRSTMIDQMTVPRSDAPEVVYAQLTTAIFGDDGEPLDTGAFAPSVDPEDGTFSGPFPQTFVPLLPRLLPEFELLARIDSVKPDWVLEEACIPDISFRSTCWRMWLTVDGVQSEVAGAASNWNGFGRPGTVRTMVSNAEVPFDPAALEAFGIPAASGAAQAFLNLDESIQFINWEGQQNRRGVTANTLHGGPRWFNGTAETTANPDPTAFIKVGRLAEVDSVWIPIHHTAQGPTEGALPNSGSVQYFGYFLAFLGRAADIRVTWSGGTITVRDVSNNVDVPFSTEYGSSWGFLNDDGDGDGTVAWWDFFCVGADAKAEWELVFGEICPAGTVLNLSATPTIHSIAMDTNGAPVPTGNGFTLYLNGMRHFFLADALPADGTEWTLRTYNGSVTASSGLDTWDPSGYSYVPIYDPGFGQSGLRSPLIPGLTIGWQVESATAPTGVVDLEAVHTVPDPYLGSSRLDLAPTTKKLMFVNLPPVATIRIYTVTGILVDILNHDDTTGGGRAEWDLRNRNNHFVASAVYFFHVVTPEGDEHVGKFTVINAAQ